MRKLVFAICISMLLPTIVIAQQHPPVSNGEDLIRLMYSTYSNDWYKYLTFKQNIFHYRSDSLIRNEVWVVAYSAPGMLHLRYQDFDSGRGWLVVNDTIYSYNHGNLIGQRPRLHDQITLGLDAYVVAPDEVIPKLKQMDFDLSIVTIELVNGKQVYQVGDPSKHCFWVTMDNMLFYGIRRVTETGVNDMVFDNYTVIYGIPVATGIQYLSNGKMYRYEKYFEIRLPTSLPQEFFDPDKFNNTRW